MSGAWRWPWAGRRDRAAQHEQPPDDPMAALLVEIAEHGPRHADRQRPIPRQREGERP